jgi:hypothetical protein
VNHEPIPEERVEDRLDGGAAYDERWVRCRRPLVMVGGELTLDALALQFSTSMGFYQAPTQTVANGGVLVIDDFGRQQCSPRDLLNRWIVPLESRIDFLTLNTGQKFEVPFMTLSLRRTSPADPPMKHFATYSLRYSPARRWKISTSSKTAAGAWLDFDGNQYRLIVEYFVREMHREAVTRDLDRPCAVAGGLPWRAEAVDLPALESACRLFRRRHEAAGCGTRTSGSVRGVHVIGVCADVGGHSGDGRTLQVLSRCQPDASGCGRGRGAVGEGALVTRRIQTTPRELRGQLAILVVVLWTVAAVNTAGSGMRLMSGQIKGTDFLHFYALARVGATDPGEFANPIRVREAQLNAVPQSADHKYPPVYGPQLAIALAPLARFTYGQALALWFAFSAVLYFASMAVVLRSSVVGRRYFQIGLLAAAGFPPFWYLLQYGQLSAIALCLVVVAWALIRRGHATSLEPFSDC